jgi:protein TonB
MATARLGHAAAGRFPRWGYLDKFYTNEVMPKAFVVSSLIFLAIIGAWIGWQKFEDYRRGRAAQHATRIKRKVKVLTAAEIGVPPSLMQQQATAVKVEVRSAPKVAMPVPVPDEEAVEETIATVEEMATGQTSNQLDFGFGEGDSLVIDAGDIGLPSPDEYVAFEQAPELVSRDDPLYPDIAREAGVEGTVLVRVLVGDDGFVKDMIIIQSIPMLDEAAAEAAWTAVFKPALQKDRPVAVWMIMPFNFSLRG